MKTFLQTHHWDLCDGSGPGQRCVSGVMMDSSLGRKEDCKWRRVERNQAAGVLGKLVESVTLFIAAIKYLTKATRVVKKVYSDSQRKVIVSCDGASMMAWAWGSCWHSVHKQEAERDDYWRLVHFPLFIWSRTPWDGATHAQGVLPLPC